MPFDDEPVLTFPEIVADRVRAEYECANVVLEYGSGGSTMLAARLPGVTLFSVESDRAWAADIETRLSDVAPHVHMHYADIGPTKAWGHPLKRKIRDVPKYFGYATSVWKRDDFRHPDLVLIDGRFRVGCFLAVMQRIERPVRVLFDDYTDRPYYHWVEKLVPCAETVGRMAIFELTPRRLPLPALPKATMMALRTQ